MMDGKEMKMTYNVDPAFKSYGRDNNYLEVDMSIGVLAEWLSIAN